MGAKLVWSTPNGDELIAEMARVSNPGNQGNKETAPRLISYLIRNRHWSPFEMINACVDIDTTRDIGRQILRHRSFTFQEFSGRYAAYADILTERECRFQDMKNRQNSIDVVGDHADKLWWDDTVKWVAEATGKIYQQALSRGIAKEQARALLPEGLVPTRMYMNGTLRSWIHYCHERTQPGVQKEHRLIAEAIQQEIFTQFPQVWAALQETTI